MQLTLFTQAGFFNWLAVSKRQKEEEEKKTKKTKQNIPIQDCIKMLLLIEKMLNWDMFVLPIFFQKQLLLDL